ncbi:MAG: hypothetical protein K6F99_08945 [Lachnospiraceae bacterium]|nr:hypothetical protein [Lachnospiraceae bacterium]
MQKIGTMMLPVHTYEVIGQKVERNSMDFYPIFADGQLILFAVKCYVDGETHIQLTEAFVDTLKGFSGQDVCLVYDKDSLYVMSEKSNLKIASGEESIESRGTFNERTKISKATKTNLSCENVKSVSCKKALKASIPDYKTISLPNVKYVTQDPYKNLCWAACVACIGNYITHSNYDTVDIAESVRATGDKLDERMNYGMISIAFIKNSGFNIYHRDFNSSSDEEIYYSLSNGWPVFSEWQSNTRHACVIRGIQTNSYLAIMDPQIGFTVAWKTNGVYSYVRVIDGSNVTLKCKVIAPNFR